MTDVSDTCSMMACESERLTNGVMDSLKEAECGECGECMSLDEDGGGFLDGKDFSPNDESLPLWSESEGAKNAFNHINDLSFGGQLPSSFEQTDSVGLPTRSAEEDNGHARLTDYSRTCTSFSGDLGSESYDQFNVQPIQTSFAGVDACKCCSKRIACFGLLHDPPSEALLLQSSAPNTEKAVFQHSLPSMEQGVLSRSLWSLHVTKGISINADTSLGFRRRRSSADMVENIGMEDLTRVQDDIMASTGAGETFRASEKAPPSSRAPRRSKSSKNVSKGSKPSSKTSKEGSKHSKDASSTEKGSENIDLFQLPNGKRVQFRMPANGFVRLDVADAPPNYKAKVTPLSAPRDERFSHLDRLLDRRKATDSSSATTRYDCERLHRPSSVLHHQPEGLFGVRESELIWPEGFVPPAPIHHAENASGLVPCGVEEVLKGEVKRPKRDKGPSTGIESVINPFSSSTTVKVQAWNANGSVAVAKTLFKEDRSVNDTELKLSLHHSRKKMVLTLNRESTGCHHRLVLNYNEISRIMAYECEVEGTSKTLAAITLAFSGTGIFSSQNCSGLPTSWCATCHRILPLALMSNWGVRMPANDDGGPKASFKKKPGTRREGDSSALRKGSAALSIISKYEDVLLAPNFASDGSRGSIGNSSSSSGAFSDPHPLESSVYALDSMNPFRSDSNREGEVYISLICDRSAFLVSRRGSASQTSPFAKMFFGDPYLSEIALVTPTLASLGVGLGHQVLAHRMSLSILRDRLAQFLDLVAHYIDIYGTEQLCLSINTNLSHAFGEWPKKCEESEFFSLQSPLSALFNHRKNANTSSSTYSSSSKTPRSRRREKILDGGEVEEHEALFGEMDDFGPTANVQDYDEDWILTACEDGNDEDFSDGEEAPRRRKKRSSAVKATQSIAKSAMESDLYHDDAYHGEGGEKIFGASHSKPSKRLCVDDRSPDGAFLEVEKAHKNNDEQRAKDVAAELARANKQFVKENELLRNPSAAQEPSFAVNWDDIEMIAKMRGDPIISKHELKYTIESLKIGIHGICNYRPMAPEALELERPPYDAGYHVNPRCLLPAREYSEALQAARDRKSGKNPSPFSPSDAHEDGANRASSSTTVMSSSSSNATHLQVDSQSPEGRNSATGKVSTSSSPHIRVAVLFSKQNLVEQFGPSVERLWTRSG